MPPFQVGGAVHPCTGCGAPLDPNLGFCPRCGQARPEGGWVEVPDPAPGAGGAAGAAPTGPSPLVERQRRRLRGAAVVLFVLGGLGVLIGGAALAAQATSPDEILLRQLEMQEGGRLEFQVGGPDRPVQGAHVAIQTLDGEPLDEATTDAEGRASFSLDGAAVAWNATVEGTPYSGRAVAESGSTTTVAIDASTRPGAADEVAGLRGMMKVLRLLGFAILGVALLMVAAGVAAWRSRGRTVALAGSGVAFALSLYLFIAALSLGLLLLVLMTGLALYFIARARPAFSAPR